jgi:hypothetical protein
MPNIIFGVYNGYNSLKTWKGGIYYFMKSLRKYNRDCKVVIVCEKSYLFQDLITFSKHMNFEIYTDFNMKYKMMYYRFEIYKKYLDEKKTSFDKILLSDINDVIFQEDPFKIQFTEDLYCALEGNNYSDKNNSSSNLNMEWIQECNPFDGNHPENYIDQYVVCAGTILGTYQGIQNYLQFYSGIQKKRVVNDQALLNIYVYNFAASKKIIEYKKSNILTLDKILFKTLNFDNNGNIINENGEKYNIIHQIDRCNLQYMLSLVE